MIITVLKDMEEGSVDAIIVSETTTTAEIDKILCTIKEGVWNGEIDNDYFTELVKRLPADCEIFDKWSLGLNTMFY